MRTILELAQEAQFVQNASNFLAVVNGMARAMKDLKEHGYFGTALANHPIALLWVDKLASMQGTQDLLNGKASRAHAYVNAFVAGETNLLTPLMSLD